MSESVLVGRMQRVHDIVTNGRSFGAVTASMVEAIDQLSNLESEPDYRLLDIHAAAAVLSSCVDVGAGSPIGIQAYRRVVLARRQLARVSVGSGTSLKRIINQNIEQGNQYFDLAKGVSAWWGGFRRDYTRRDTGQGSPPKLDFGKYSELRARTAGTLLVCAQVATNLEEAYVNREPVSNAFGHAGQLFRYIADQPYPEAAPPAVDLLERP